MEKEKSSPAQSAVIPPQPSMDLIIHRGTHEIGGSCVEIRTAGSAILLDIGMPLMQPGGGPFNPGLMDGLPWHELVRQGFLPNISGIYIGDTRPPSISGILISHAHQAKAWAWFLNNGPENVDALLMEGTMMGRQNETVETEWEIENRIVRELKGTRGIALACFSAQNIDRLVSFYRAAVRTRRELVVDVYTASVLADLCGPRRGCGALPRPCSDFPNLRVWFPRRLCLRMEHMELQHIIRKFGPWKRTKEAMNRHPGQYIMMVRPNMVSDLERMDNIGNGICIYSQWEGYLKDKPARDFRAYTAWRGLAWKHIHTSGHAPLETLKEMAQKVNARMVIPLHTLHPEAYAASFRNVREFQDRELIQV